MAKVTVNSIGSSKKSYLSIFILSTGILLALLLRVNFLFIETADYRVFLSGWYDFIKTHGGIKALGYPFSDYTPPYLYLLVLATYLPFQKIVAIKLISILFDFICAIFVFFIVRLKHRDPLTLVLSFLAVLFFPTVFTNSAYWGQCDAVYTAGLLGSLYFLLKKKPVLSLLLYSVAFSVKQQSIFFFPVLLVLLLRKTLALKHFLIIPITYVLLTVPSYLVGRPMDELLLVYFNQATKYKLLTGIPNIYIFLPPSYRLEAFGVFSILITIVLVGILSFFIVKKRIPVTREMIIKLSFLSLLIVPYFLPRMHERYYYPADLFSVVYGFYFKQYFYIPLAMGFVSFFSYCPFLFGKESIDFRILALLVTMVLIVALTDFKRFGAGDDV
jgi:Gpi18-like mannosyltransferase